MFNIGTIKITQNINQEMPAQQLQGVRSFQDAFSSESFFSILKNQIQSIEQSTAAFSDRFDTVKNDASVSGAVKDTFPYEAETRDATREYASQAVGTTAEQVQKTAASNQENETKTHDDVKGALAQKPSAEHESKKALDKDNDAGARVRQKQKSKAKDQPDMYDLHEGLHRMIDIHKGKEQSETRNAKRTNQELHILMRDLKNNPNREMLKKTIDKLAALVEKLDAGTLGTGNKQHIAGTIAGIKNFLAKLKAVLEKNQNQKNPATDNTMSVAKDLLGRIETMLENVKEDTSYHRAGKDSQGNSDILHFGHLKADISPKHADTAAQPRSSLFRENIDAIIQNAKVFVKDSKNGSFSVSLHPRELGSVNINLGLLDGVVHGKFLVNTQEARDLLLSNLELIKQQLLDAGISVGEFQVNVNDQREKLLNGQDRDGIILIPPAEHAVEIESEYVSNAKPYYDGHINLVI